MPARELSTFVSWPYRLNDQTYCEVELAVKVAIRDQIGRGAAATVWRADVLEASCQDEKLGSVDWLAELPKEIAVKEIDLRSLRLGQHFERERSKLRREVSILSRLHHPSIVNLMGVMETDDSAFLLMELVKEGELFSRIVSMQCMSEVQARYVMLQVIAALEFIHKSDVVHRDLKLENILVADEKEGGFLVCKIADFGLSKYVQGADARSFVGTPQYWAPEVILASRSQSTYGPAADLWSLGCVLYVLIGGAYPFDDRGGNLESNILAGKYHFRYPNLASSSSECKDLIRGLLQVDPEKRMTLDDIKRHPWTRMTEGLAPLPDLRSYGHFDSRTVITSEIGGEFKADGGPMLAHLSAEPMARKRAPSTVPSARSALEVAFVEDRIDDVDIRPRRPVVEYNAFAPIIAAMEAARIDDGDKTNRVFDPHELVKLQLSILRRLQMAHITFKDQPVLSQQLGMAIREFKSLTSDSGLVVHKSGDTCKLVLEVFPDLSDAVQQQMPDLALELLQMLQTWCNEMMQDAAKIQDRYAKFVESVNRISLSANLVKNVTSVDNDHSPIHCRAAGPVRLQDVAGADFEDDCRRRREDLIADVEHFANQFDDCGKCECLAVPDKDITEVVFDFLFMPSYQKSSIFVEPVVDENEIKARKIFLAALEQLSRVEEILNAMRIFWANLQLTVDRLLKIREHTKHVIKHSVASERFRASAAKRMDKYEAFWNDLVYLCDVYTQELHAQFPRAFRECEERASLYRAQEVMQGVRDI